MAARFVVRPASLNSYNDLVEIVQRAAPPGMRGAISTPRLFWTDEDGDMCSLCCDLTLQEAIASLSEGKPLVIQLRVDAEDSSAALEQGLVRGFDV